MATILLFSLMPILMSLGIALAYYGINISNLSVGKPPKNFLESMWEIMIAGGISNHLLPYFIFEEFANDAIKRMAKIRNVIAGVFWVLSVITILLIVRIGRL
jgi:uncharacterized membrane protein